MSASTSNASWLKEICNSTICMINNVDWLLSFEKVRLFLHGQLKCRSGKDIVVEYRLIIPERILDRGHYRSSLVWTGLIGRSANFLNDFRRAAWMREWVVDIWRMEEDQWRPGIRDRCSVRPIDSFIIENTLRSSRRTIMHRDRLTYIDTVGSPLRPPV